MFRMNRRHLCAEVMVENHVPRKAKERKERKKKNEREKKKSKKGHSCSYFHQKQTTTPVTFNQ